MWILEREIERVQVCVYVDTRERYRESAGMFIYINK